MKQWKADTIPQYTLSVKYLKMILTPKEYEALIKKYMKAKEATAEARVRKDCATDPAN